MLRILVDLVHLEDVVGRGQDHLGAAREDHRLQDVHDLGDVGHLDPLRVFVEEVEVEGGDDRVAHRALLEEVARVGAGFDVKPGAPFVDEQADAALRVVAVHDLDVALQDGLEAEGLGEDVVVLGVGEVGRGALAVPFDDRIIMEGDAVHPAPGVLHQGFGPDVIAVRSAAGDLVEAVRAEVAEVGRIAAIDVRVILRRHVAAAAPGLVAHAEILDFPGLLTAVGAPQVGHRAAGGGGHVLHPFGHFLDGAAADVAADVGLAAELLAEVQELVGAETVVFEGAAPVVVGDAGAALQGADAVHPVVVVGEAAARPAHHRDLEPAQGLQHVEAVAVLVRDGGVLADPEAAVDAAAEVFGELAVDFFGDQGAGGAFVDTHRRVLGVEQGSGQQEAGKAEQSFHRVFIRVVTSKDKDFCYFCKLYYGKNGNQCGGPQPGPHPGSG